jgi:phytoene dehydrogenase-like protein
MEPKRSIIIIGAGLGGLSVGIYGRLNGYATKIFEAHSIAGGQCTSWKRKGYTFDACIHHLFGCSPGTKINDLWRELGAMPAELIYTKDCVSVASPDGRMFRDLYDADDLERELMALSPGDAKIIRTYVDAIRAVAEDDLMGTIITGSLAEKLALLPAALRLRQYFRTTMEQFAGRFSDPFLRKAFPLLEYSNPTLPVILHFQKHAYGLRKDIAWPAGGSLTFARSIEKRYKELGGEVHYGRKVVRILVENGRAAGVTLADGSEHRADIVISDADGRKTIMELLEGKFLDERLRAVCAEPPDEAPFAVTVFLGVDRDLSAEPSSLVQLLAAPVRIAGLEHGSLEMQVFGFDRTMAPPGKGVIKVDLPSTYSYWKELAADKARYDEEKRKVSDTVIGLLEGHFPGLRGQVEALDVITLLTWERFMGGTHGFANAPNKKLDFVGSLLGKGQEKTLPGLEGFYFVGVWMTSTGALFSNALSGRSIIRDICKKDGKRFTRGTPKGS